MTGILLLLHW